MDAKENKITLVELEGIEGHVYHGSKFMCSYGYDRKQRLYNCMIKPFKNEKGFKMFYAKSPSQLSFELNKHIDKIIFSPPSQTKN